MYHFNLGPDIIDFIADDAPLKQGLYTPITHIPILSAEALYELQPDYVLILAWNFAEPIMKAHQMYSENIGKFILPMPAPQIVEWFLESYTMCLLINYYNNQWQQKTFLL